MGSCHETGPKLIRCKAAVCRVPGEPLVFEEVVVAPPKAFEVRIKIICSSLCHTDISYWRSKEFAPSILGHETVGIVESVGEGAEEVAVGDRVVPMFQPNCRKCGPCRSEKSNLCDAVQARSFGMPRDGTSRITDAAGASLTNLFGISSFSEYTVVDVASIVKVDPNMPPDRVCPLSCGISTGLGAAWRVADVEAGSSVVIFGLGAVGLAVAEGARLRGAAKIIGVDLNPNKILIGKKFGITDFINPKEIGEKPVNEIVKELTKGGADYSFECIGLTSTMNEAFRSSKNGGKTIILGLDVKGSLCINTEELLFGKTIVGSILGGTKVKVDIPIFIKKYLDKELQLDEFITHQIGFDEINKAFDLLNAGECIRCIIWMDK
ncbi:Alcohol dehydrogenase-like 2 [Platanthera zijinensis]|uniref:Alcohol dehydrogenase-like 2 n=1 Tax=Platanthera zijinensis TaxID=2320716 RepID=A0AAP0G6P5_9ASPA